MFIKSKESQYLIYILSDAIPDEFEQASKLDVINYCEKNEIFFHSLSDEISSLLTKKELSGLKIKLDNKPLTEQQRKYQGFDYQGVMCSATKEDQNGLVAILVGFQAGLISKTPFEFSNGNNLTLTADNITDFSAQWSTFRQQFFNAEQPTNA